MKVNLLFFACLLLSSLLFSSEIIIIMFCPTAVDAYFGKKLSHLDLTFNKTSSYQERVSFEERVKEAEDTRSRYPNKIPLVIEKHKADKYLQDIDKVATIRPVQLYFLGFSQSTINIRVSRSSGWCLTR